MIFDPMRLNAKTGVEVFVGGWMTISRRTIVGDLSPYNGAELEIHFAFMSEAIAKLVPILRTALLRSP
jgi:hypothetical protein